LRNRVFVGEGNSVEIKSEAAPGRLMIEQTGSHPWLHTQGS